MMDYYVLRKCEEGDQRGNVIAIATDLSEVSRLIPATYRLGQWQGPAETEPKNYWIREYYTDDDFEPVSEDLDEWHEQLQDEGDSCDDHAYYLPDIEDVHYLGYYSMFHVSSENYVCLRHEGRWIPIAGPVPSRMAVELIIQQGDIYVQAKYGNASRYQLAKKEYPRTKAGNQLLSEHVRAYSQKHPLRCLYSLDVSGFSPGDTVLYLGFSKTEKGTVTGINSDYVFVDYGQGHSKATRPFELLILP